MIRVLLLAAAVSMPGLAWAEGRGVTIANRSSETIRRIQISPAGSGNAGDNRLRSQLPPGTVARITYSTGCPVDVRLGFESGRTEEFLGLDACTDLQVSAGQGTAGVTTAPVRQASDTTARSVPGAPGKPGATPPAPAIAPVVVPPWTGRSITKRFGGME